VRGSVRPAGPRVALRPPRDSDHETLSGLVDISDEDELLTITRSGEDEPIGALRYREDASEGWLRFEFVAVAPELRGLGLESEGVRLLEAERSARRAAVRFWAAVDRDDGLGVYFWLRLGYRPASQSASSWQADLAEGIIVMVKEDAGGD
jgi:GNAT superfamily N-acetyltransferase